MKGLWKVNSSKNVLFIYFSFWGGNSPHCRLLKILSDILFLWCAHSEILWCQFGCICTFWIRFHMDHMDNHLRSFQMCISGLGFGDILCWILLPVSVEKVLDILWRFRNSWWQRTGIENGACVSYTGLYLSCSYHIVITCSPLASLLADTKLLHKGTL